MKEKFFLGIGVFICVSGVAYLGWLVFDAFQQMYHDWRLGKELTELEALGRDRRRQRQEELQAAESGEAPRD